MKHETSIEGLNARIWAIVDALPQREAISTADARLWVEEVVAQHGEMAVWHAIRLNGFGGSEIGVLVRNLAGVRADHQASAHDIVEGKLMRRTPSESNAHLRRGHENEDLHARRFWEKYGAKRDLEAYEALKGVQGSHPWMRYSPDDLVQMPVEMRQNDQGMWIPAPAGGQSKRWLIDYKAPSKIEEGNEIAFQYACQLTQGAILCAEAGIELDGMMLSQFDWANWSLKDDAVVWSEDLGRMVLGAGDHYWQFVLRGEVPGYIRTPMLDGVDEYVRQYNTAAQTYASLQALRDAAEKRASELKALMVEPVAKRRFGDAKLAFGAASSAVLTVSASKMLDREAAFKALPSDVLDRCTGKNVYDADAMAARLTELGQDIKDYRKRDLDAAKVYAAAAVMGLDPDLLVREQLTFKIGKGVKEQMQDYIDQHYPLSAVMAACASDKLDVQAQEMPEALDEPQLTQMAANDDLGQEDDPESRPPIEAMR